RAPAAAAGATAGRDRTRGTAGGGRHSSNAPVEILMNRILAWGSMGPGAALFKVVRGFADARRSADLGRRLAVGHHDQHVDAEDQRRQLGVRRAAERVEVAAERTQIE